MRLEQLRQLASIAAQGLRFEKLGDAFVQPGRATAGGKLIDERVSQFMLQNPRQLGRHGIEAADGNAEFAVVEGSRPGGGARNVKESLLGVERYQNVVARRRAQITSQIVVVRFERGQDLSAECFRGLLALVVQDEMAAFALGEIGLDVLFALRLCQVLLHVWIGTQFERMLP